MADNFDMKKFLVENKLGAYSKLKEGEDVFADIDDDLAYGTDSKEDAIEYLQDIINYCQKKIVDLENEKGFEEEDEAFGGINETVVNDPRVEEIIQMLKDLNVDGETMEYIIRQVGMDDQMANQLVHNKTEEAISQVTLPKGITLGSDNPEGDKLVLRFLQGIAKKFDYPVAKAAMFVKERLKKLGY